MHWGRGGGGAKKGLSFQFFYWFLNLSGIITIASIVHCLNLDDDLFMKWQNNVGNSRKRSDGVLFAGFEFSLMVVGASGLGKSTLVNSMFLTDIYADEKEPGKQELVQKQQEAAEGDSRQTLKVEAHHKVLVENGVKLSLTVRIMMMMMIKIMIVMMIGD